VLYYSDKLGQLHQGDMPRFNINEGPLLTAIKSINPDEHTSLLDQLLTFYQIKLLEKRIDYNDFNEKTKINVIMS
jgi:hypothetical protein